LAKRFALGGTPGPLSGADDLSVEAPLASVMMTPPRVSASAGLGRVLSPRPENQDAQGWNRQAERVRPPVQRQGNRFYPAAVSQAASAVKQSVAVQDFSPFAVHGRPDAIVVPRHGSEIADEESHVVMILGPSQEGDDTPFPIAAIHPLKSGRFEIHLIQGRLPPVKSVQIAHPPAQ